MSGKSGGKPGRENLVRALIAALVLVMAGILFYAGLVINMCLHSRDKVVGEPRVMVILGCQVKPWGPSVLLQDRLDTALEYLDDHPDMTVVVSGGQGPDEHISEAQCMMEYLVAHGVDPEHIIPEDRSHNTWQNVCYTLELLTQRGFSPDEPVLLVTNGFHLGRAEMLWKRASGTEAGGLAAPASHFPSAVYMFFREPIGMVKAFLLDWN